MTISLVWLVLGGAVGELGSAAPWWETGVVYQIYPRCVPSTRVLPMQSSHVHGLRVSLLL